MEREAAEEVTDAVLSVRGQNRWFLPGTRDRLIEAAMMNTSRNAIVDQFSDILDACEVDDPGSDPCDEINLHSWRQRQIAEWRSLSRLG